jgi:hypothetical protein
MKISITESQFYNLIPPAVRRRMTSKDLEILDDIVRSNMNFFINQGFDGYYKSNLSDSLNEFIDNFKVREISQNLDDTEWERQENLIYDIFRQLLPYLEKRYYDLLYDYHTRNSRHASRSSIRGINENQNKLQHLYRRAGEIEDIFNEFEDLFKQTAKTLNKDGFIHATSMFIGDVIAGEMERKGVDFDYVTLRNQIKRFIETHFYEKLIDFYAKHKKQLSESKEENLSNELPSFLKRRVTQEDLDYLDRYLPYYLSEMTQVDSFDDFSDFLMDDLLYDFVTDRKTNEIRPYEDPHLGRILDDESRDEVFDMYLKLKPFLINKYKDRIYKTWKELNGVD